MIYPFAFVSGAAVTPQFPRRAGMKPAKSIRVTVLVLGFVALILNSTRACTIFSYSQGGSVLVGNNEDVYVFYRHNFDHSVTVNLAEELRKGPHQVMLKDALGDTTESLTVPKVTATVAISAAEVLRKALEARGGAAAAMNLHSIHAKGVADFGLGWLAPSPQELFEMRPNRYRAVVDQKSPVGLKPGQYAEGFNGRKGWNAQTEAAPRILKGKALRERRDDAEFFAWYDAPTNYKSAVCLGEASFDGTKCYAVDTKTKSRREEIHYYNINTFLLSGITRDYTNGKRSDA